MENKYCVYFHINPVKNDIFYVGIGNAKRPYNKKHHRNQFWHNTVNKYGFVVDITESNLTWEEACEREKFYISKIGRRDLKKGPLVNMTDGGDGSKGRKPSQETRNKLSKSGKGRKFTQEHKDKIGKSKIGNKFNLGNKHTQEAKNKVSKAHKGKVLTKKHKIKLSKAHKGKKFTEERKEKMRLAQIKRWVIKNKKPVISCGVVLNKGTLPMVILK